MPDSDLYVGLAGVAVVFAGFAGISVVLTGRQPEHWRYVDVRRLSAMIGLSILSAFCSLLPLVVARFVSSTELVWQLSSAFFFVFAAYAPIRGYREIRRAYREPDYDPASKLSNTLLFGAMLLALLALVANILAIAPALGEGFYLLALVCYLGLAARMFVRTLRVLRATGDE